MRCVHDMLHMSRLPYVSSDAKWPDDHGIVSPYASGQSSTFDVRGSISLELLDTTVNDLLLKVFSTSISCRLTLGCAEWH